MSTLDINTYNETLLNNTPKLDISQYFVRIHKEFYSNIDISFMNYFLEICNKNGQFIIKHEMLKKYGVINNIETSAIIKRCLEQYKLEESKEYMVYNVVHHLIQGQTITKKEYILTPDAFKICLIRAKNSKKYANYYLLLEKVFKYYSKYDKSYELARTNRLLSMKDEKIDNLQLKIDNLLKNTNQIIDQNGELKEKVTSISNQNGELKEKVTNISNQNGELKEKVTNISNQNGELKEKVTNISHQNDKIIHQNSDLSYQNNHLINEVDDIKNVLQDILPDRSPKPPKQDDYHYFMLFKSNIEDNTYQCIKAQSKYIDKKIKMMDDYSVIISKSYNANPIDMFNRFKDINKKDFNIIKNDIRAQKQLSSDEKKLLLDNLKKHPPIRVFRSTIIINPELISEQEMIEKIEECDNEKFNVDIP